MSSSDKGDTEGCRIAQAPSTQLASQLRLSPVVTGAITKIASLSPTLDYHRESIAKQMAPTLAMFNRINYDSPPSLQSELARTATTIAGLDNTRTQLINSPGYKTLADASRKQLGFDSVLSAQMKGISDSLLKAANISAAMPPPTAASALAAATARMAQSPDIMASVRPLIEQIRSNIASTYRISEVFAATNASMFSASQTLTELNETLKVKQSLITSDLAKAVYASSAALRDVDALTLSRINLATGYADHVSTVLDEDAGLAEVAEVIKSRFIDRFTMSREAAQNAVHVLIWMALFSAIVYGVVYGPAAVSMLIGAVCSATGRLNADSVAKIAAKNLVPLREESPQS